MQLDESDFDVMIRFSKGYGLMNELARKSTNFQIATVAILDGKNILYFRFPLWILVPGLCNMIVPYHTI